MTKTIERRDGARVGLQRSCHPLWLFELEDGFMACGYKTASHKRAVQMCESEYDVSVRRAVYAKLPFPEYRALVSVNREGHDWPAAYSALIGVFLDAYILRTNRDCSKKRIA